MVITYNCVGTIICEQLWNEWCVVCYGIKYMLYLSNNSLNQICLAVRKHIFGTFVFLDKVLTTCYCNSSKHLKERSLLSNSNLTKKNDHSHGQLTHNPNRVKSIKILDMSARFQIIYLYSPFPHSIHL